MELPTDQTTCEESIEKTLSYITSLRDFQTQLEKEGKMDATLRLNMAEKINEFTKELAQLQARLVDILKLQGDVD